jgi:hypothetical protein
MGRREPFPDSGDGDSELESAAVGGQEVPGVEEVAHVRHQRAALSRHALRTSRKKNVEITDRLKVHKNENFFGSDFEFYTISL